MWELSDVQRLDWMLQASLCGVVWQRSSESWEKAAEKEALVPWYDIDYREKYVWTKSWQKKKKLIPYTFRSSIL